MLRHYLICSHRQFMALNLKDEKKETLLVVPVHFTPKQPRQEKREKNVFSASLAVAAQREKQNLNMEKLNKLQRHVNRYEKFCNASNLKKFSCTIDAAVISQLQLYLAQTA